MPYPDPPDWNSGTPLSAWYLYAANGQTSVCSSTGWDMLAALQSQLHARLTGIGAVAAIGPLPTYDGSSILDAGVNDPTSTQMATGWDTNTLQALYAVAQHYGVDQSYLSAIQSDATSGASQVSQATLQTGIWIGDSLDHASQGGSDIYGQGSPADAQIPSVTLFPSTTTAPPVPPSQSSGSQCNSIPPSVASVISVQPAVIPFVFDEWAVFGVLVVATGIIIALTRNVPIRVKGTS